MKYGLKKETIESIQNAIAHVPAIKKVVLYGSRAKGNYRAGSDVDITLFGENLTLDNSVYPLMDLLDELYTPYSFDICIFDYIDNENLVEHIQRVGKVIFT